MQAVSTNIFTRDDTFFGVCQAIGEDFGFNPNWLRIGFGLPLIWYPLGVFGAYAALAVIVLASRLIFPRPRPAARPAAEAPSLAAQPSADNETLSEVLAVAA